MSIQHFYQTNEAIVDRIDSIIRELEILKSIATQGQKEKLTKNLVDQLYGALVREPGMSMNKTSNGIGLIHE
ncbi:MAG: hypothetical protein JXA42_13455 [Anaerolineales bacterium]|nr:hypothetical protein [Anaerolineales bacterium]